MGIVILLITLFKSRLLQRYRAKFLYMISIWILLRIICVFKINVILHSSSKLRTYPYDFNKFYKLNYSVEETVKSLDIINLLYYVWIIGIVVGVCYFVYSNLKLYKNINRIQKDITDKGILMLLDHQKKTLNIKKNIKMKVLKGIYSPMIVGIINPRIILPDKKYEKDELILIFRHELIHYRRKDNLLKLIISMVNIIYWFNPLIYIFRQNFNEFCELSCDEKAIGKSSMDEKKNIL